jgi:hypothetical protein
VTGFDAPAARSSRPVEDLDHLPGELLFHLDGARRSRPS